MGTKRMEAWISCRSWQLDYTDEILMSRICHRWNDRQTRPLDIRFARLLDDMPYRGQSRPERMLRRSLMRLSDLGILHIEGNGRRYLKDRWLHISITCAEFWQHFEGKSEAAQEEPVQPQLLQSRALMDQTEPMIHGGSNSIHGGSNTEPMIHGGSNSRAERASHSRVKIFKDVTSSKDDRKAAALRGDILESEKCLSIAETSNPEPAPRPALVPTATLTEPETAAAVFNTLEIDEKEDTVMDDVTRARAAELLELEQEIDVQLRDRSITDADEWQQRREEMQDIRRHRRHLETLLSDEEWHERARTAAATQSERLGDLIADLVAQRWTDFPYRIDWPHRLDQMVEAYPAADRRGRDLLDDVLAASAAPDKNNALILLTARWLEPQEEKPDDDAAPPQALPQMPAEQADHRVLQTPVDDRRPGEHVQGMQEGQETEVLQEDQSQAANDRRPHHQALHQVPADQEPDRVPRRQKRLRRPQARLQDVFQRPAADKAAVPPDARQEEASPPTSPPVPALLETSVAERVLCAQPPSGPPDPAVQSVS